MRKKNLSKNKNKRTKLEIRKTKMDEIEWKIDFKK